MRELKGRLKYMGWFNSPWKLVTDSGEIDLWPIINKFLISLNGKFAKHDNNRLQGYFLGADESSESKFKYIPNKEIVLENTKSLGFANIHSYLRTALAELSGRLVCINISDTKIELNPDPSEEVFGVYFISGNSCEIPDGAEKTVCKIGEPDCCIFCSFTPDGFQCEKYNSYLARELLDRLAKKTMNATRIGNCALLGRKEKEEVSVAG